MFAHSPSRTNPTWHRLDDHLRGTASLARQFAQPFGCGDLAWWCGLIHDCGKAWCQWQARLKVVAQTDQRVGLDHKSYGVQLARRHGLRPAEFAVAGHHGGLDRQDAVDGLIDDEDDEQLRDCWADVDATVRQLVPEVFAAVPQLPPDFDPGADEMTAEFVVRFVYSCLVDADALDTRAHRLGEPVQADAVLDAAGLLPRLLDRRAAFLAERGRGPMDELREVVFDAAMAAAVDDPGLFRLAAPTGAAKTIAAAAFALKHAAEHGKRRVIVAVPFITITEQNAKVYRDLLDEQDTPVVLEHHSAVDYGEDRAGRHRWQRLAAENWDAPFVVTTTVQLLESLFGRKPSQMRKVHRLAGSVIVFDEVQALPHRLLPQVADALRILSQRFGVTVLLSSATQPELASLGPLRDLDVKEIVTDPVRVFGQARRVRFQWMVQPRPHLAEVLQQCTRHDQALMVLNTVKDARLAYRHALEAASPGATVLHLSTGMCAAHRRDVLARARDLLSAGEPLILVSTSLIEAGVDVDFPVAYRAVAPPESIAQTAGRCNREGKLGPEGGLVIVFDPVDGGAPPSFATQVTLAQAFFGPGLAEPEDIDALRGYFTTLYGTLGVEGPASVSAEIGRNRARWDFRAVADGPLRRGSRERDRGKAFRLINEDTVTVAVRYGDTKQRALLAWCLAALRGQVPNPEAHRRIQPFLTTLRRCTATSPAVAPMLLPGTGDLFEWDGRYDDGFGLVLEPEGDDFIL